MDFCATIRRNNFLRRLIMPLAICCAVLPLSAFTLVIDPGHGGKDYGAIGNISNEKTINLKVAGILGKMVEDSLTDVSTVFTRKDDRFVTLQDRAKIANKASGDLFVSIHVNSVDRKNRNRTKICGASVYTLGLHKSADNLEVAKRENAVMLLDKDYHETYQGFNPESSESYIIFELSQNKHFEQSVNLAMEIQNELCATAGRADKGVRQAGFWVLWSTGMPAVLVELDFICNPDEEKFLASDEGQQKMATSIFNAIRRYIATNGSLPQKNTVSGDDVPLIGKNHIGKYTVVFLTTPSLLGASSSRIKDIPDVHRFPMGKLHRYCTAPVASMSEAESLLSDVKNIYPSAFIKLIE